MSFFALRERSVRLPMSPPPGTGYVKLSPGHYKVVGEIERALAQKGINKVFNTTDDAMCCGHCHGCDSYMGRLNVSIPSFPKEVRVSIKTGFHCLLPSGCLLTLLFPRLVTNNPTVKNMALHMM